MVEAAVVGLVLVAGTLALVVGELGVVAVGSSLVLVETLMDQS